MSARSSAGRGAGRDGVCAAAAVTVSRLMRHAAAMPGIERTRYYRCIRRARTANRCAGLPAGGYMVSRRDVMRTAGQAMAAAVIAPRVTLSAEARTFCFFSKHLPDLGWSDLGKAVKDAGFDGVDLTVRAGGHV